jgi:hypothetical protein
MSGEEKLLSCYATQNCCRRLVTAAVGSVALLVPIACSSTSAPPPSNSTPGTSSSSAGSFKIRTFSAGPNESTPGAITRLGAGVYVAFRNGVGPKGQRSSSGAMSGIVQEYTLEGAPGASWTLRGHIDGLTADPDGHRLVATVTEDANSSVYTIVPGANPPIAHYTYSQNPLPHGGGTGSISLYRGHLLVSATNPTVADGPAVYRVTLNGTTADVSPVFADNADALVANKGQQEDQHTTLALKDPGSTQVVPKTSPRFAGDFVLAGQGDEEQVYFDESAQPSERLHVLELADSVADTVWVQQPSDTLWVSDADHNNIAAINGAFRPGEAITAVTPRGTTHYLGELNLDKGTIAQLPGLSAVVPAGGLLMVSPRG